MRIQCNFHCFLLLPRVDESGKPVVVGRGSLVAVVLPPHGNIRSACRSLAGGHISDAQESARDHDSLHSSPLSSTASSYSIMNQPKASPTGKAANDTPSTIQRSDGCKCLETLGRNLVVCIDGTSNQFGEKVCQLRSL